MYGETAQVYASFVSDVRLLVCFVRTFDASRDERDMVRVRRGKTHPLSIGRGRSAHV